MVKVEAFESLMSMLLEREGYWTKAPYRVTLTKDEKQRLGRPTLPRWELDLVGYKGENNELLVVECKSFLDWSGVRYNSLLGEIELGKTGKRIRNIARARPPVNGKQNGI